MKTIKKLKKTSAVIIVSILIVGTLLCVGMYAVIQNSFFEITASHETEAMKIMEILGSDLLDAKLHNLKSDVSELAAQYGELLSKSGASRQKEILSGIPFKEYRQNYCYFSKDAAVCRNEHYRLDTELLDLSIVLTSGESKIFNPYFDENDNYIIAAAAPVLIDGEPVGVFVELLDGFCLSRWLQNMFSFMSAGTAYVVDTEDYNIAVTRDENFDWITTRYNAAEYAALEPSDENISIARLEGLALKGETGFGTYEWADGISYVAYGPLHETGWGFFVGFYESEFEAYSRQVSAISGRAGIFLSVAFLVFMGSIIAFVLYNFWKERRYTTQLLIQKKEIEQQAQRIAASEKRFRIAMGHTRDIIVEYRVDSDSMACFSSENEVSYSSYRDEALKREMLGEKLVLDEESFKMFGQAFDSICQGMLSTECVLRAYRHPEEKWFRLSLTSITDIHGRPVRVIGILKDITKEKAADHDPLTGLLNKAAMTNQAKEIARNSIGYGAFIMIDVDFFKRVNDTYGHLVGDKVLVKISEIIKNIFCGEYIAGRFGGDEFCAVCAHKVTKEELTKKLEQLCREVCSITLEECGNPQVSCSCGVAPFTKGRSFEEVYQNADSVLYQVKENGKNGFRFYSE